MAERKKEEGFVDRVKDRAGRTVGYVSERAVAAKEGTENYIAANPWKSIAIAAAVGAVVALGVNALLTRERRYS